MEFYISLNELQRFQYHCEIEKMHIQMTKDINYIYTVLKAYKVEVINPYDLNPTEIKKFQMVGQLTMLAMKKLEELTAKNNIL
jgi:hypothetical protein